MAALWRAQLFIRQLFLSLEKPAFSPSDLAPVGPARLMFSSDRTLANSWTNLNTILDRIITARSDIDPKRFDERALFFDQESIDPIIHRTRLGLYTFDATDF